MFRSLLCRVSLYAVGGALAVVAVTERTESSPGTSQAPEAPGLPESSETAETEAEPEEPKKPKEPEEEARVVGPGGVRLLEAPARGASVLGDVGAGERVVVICVAEGERGTAWYLVRTDHYAWAPARDLDIDDTRGEPFWC